MSVQFIAAPAGYAVVRTRRNTDRNGVTSETLHVRPLVMFVTDPHFGFGEVPFIPGPAWWEEAEEMWQGGAAGDWDIVHYVDVEAVQREWLADVMKQCRRPVDPCPHDMSSPDRRIRSVTVVHRPTCKAHQRNNNTKEN